MKKIQSKYILFILCFVAALLPLLTFSTQKNQNQAPKQPIASTSTNTKDNNSETKNDWKSYAFKEIGLSFSAPKDLAVTGNQSDKDSFILTIQRGNYPEKTYYQLYGMYNLTAKNVMPQDLKKDLEATSIQETTIAGFPSISGQYKGDRNRFVTYIITDRGLLTLATSQPTDENKAFTETILKTFKFE